MVEKIELEEDEQILIQVRKHWFVFLLQILGILVLGVIPLVFYGIIEFALSSNVSVIDISRLSTVPASLSSYTGVLVALYAGWLIILWMGLFSVWTNYYLDVWTITSKRLIAADQKGFFFRTTASFRLEKLQDCTVNINGMIATLLDYGDLEMQTAGEERFFKAYGLPSPGNLKGIILGASDALMGNGPHIAQITKDNV